MSLENHPQPPQWNLGVIASKDFDGRDLLDDTLGPKLDSIRHLFTNGANPLIGDWAAANGVSYTVCPVSGGRGLPASTRDIIEASDFVLLIATPESKSAGQIAKMCEERAAADEANPRLAADGETVLPPFKWRKMDYEPIAHWREKLERVSEIIDGMDSHDLKASPWAQSVKGVVG